MITGPLLVTDGDTVRIGDVKIRLHGIDAPEQAQRCGGKGAPVWACGAWASGEVRARYAGREARCEWLDTDRYGRAVARCEVDGEDMAAALVRSGLAFAYTRYSLDYLDDERAAADQGRGLHAVGVQSPADFRQFVRQTAALLHARGAPEGCLIKGNISRNGGARIYHLPGQRHYDDTRINAAQGERWFCNTQEARAAGWRPAHN
ncbi:thermonuclease family protein [Pacificoceanicola onchidii]|uniref:thermonuclease family protein n=1 Tax=Pacificoceanicola onchidii TaxID=2562685 RepID=UPI001F0CE264|nr:thermonuclease family protein [Pacificoceanicola onchidii]